MKTISVDFQGWPIKAMTLGELLERFGLHIDETIDNTKCFISGLVDKSMIDAYPMILEDDGMGYGIKPKYVTEISKEIYNDERGIKENVFNIFADYQENSPSQDQT